MKGRDESCVSVYRCEQRELSAWKEKLSEYCRNSGQTLAATDCRAFTEDLIETVRSHSAMEAFYGRYTDSDVLLIGDMDSVSGKESTQNELVRILRKRQEQNRLTVLAAEQNTDHLALGAELRKILQNAVEEPQKLLDEIRRERKWERMNQRLRILFIGNRHTYFNDMPDMVARRFREEGFDCEVTMIAHGGWYLEQHVKEPDVRFNILYGHYDYVVLQEHAHPFGPEEKFFEAARMLSQWIREAGSKPVIYMTWAKKEEEHEQAHMTEVHKAVAEENGALLAPVGENWWAYMRSWPQIEMYYEDGAHASAAGSDFAAKYIWETIRQDLYRTE